MSCASLGSGWSLVFFSFLFSFKMDASKSIMADYTNVTLRPDDPVLLMRKAPSGLDDGDASHLQKGSYHTGTHWPNWSRHEDCSIIFNKYCLLTYESIMSPIV
jgi:hypothetical protein